MMAGRRGAVNAGGGFFGALLLFALLLALLLTTNVRAEMAPAAGRALIASPRIADPRFQQSVILLLQHGEAGAGGVVLNRPSRLDLSHLLPELSVPAATPLYWGGPVEGDRLLALVAGEAPSGAAAILDGLYLVGPRLALEQLQQPEAGPVRLFFGYAGWGPGQLEAEIGRGDWLVVPADRDWVFDPDPVTLWERLQPAAPPVYI